MNMNRGKLILELIRRDLNQTELANLSGTSRATINYVLRGKSCSYGTCSKIAAALNLPLETLLKSKEV